MKTFRSAAQHNQDTTLSTSQFLRRVLLMGILVGSIAWLQQATWAQEGPTPAPLEQGSIQAGPQRLSLWELLKSGGPLMFPIYAMSVLVVTLVIDRLLALRANKVMPRELLSGISELSSAPGGFDPRAAYHLAQQYPSAAASVLRAMLLKVGRPHLELEQAVTDASEREAARLYAHVRWLNLSAAVAPLMGLLGTVWGMIRAFYDTTQLQPGENRADFLAEGIYIALVTTLGGLAVAIPAAICAHYFEGRIEAIIHRIDEMLFHLMPQVERFEGRLRMIPRDASAEQLSAEAAADQGAAPASSSPVRAETS